jgi:phosphoglycerate dehydrogenase-like enzyme
MTADSTPLIFSARPLPLESHRYAEALGVRVIAYDGPGSVPPEQLRAMATRADAMITTVSERVGPDVLDVTGRRVRVLSNLATGTDNIDLAAAIEAGVTVTRVPASITRGATAELTLLLILMAARQPQLASSDLRSGRWGAWDLTRWTGTQLEGRTLGLVGFGAIGQRVGEFAHAIGMRVQFARRTPGAAPTWAAQVDLDRLVTTSDVLSIHVPLTGATRNLIGAAELDRVRPGAILVNTSRGGIVDEGALLNALDSGRVRSAGLDVFETEPVPTDHPLLAHPRVVTTPHIGSATTETRQAMLDSALSSCVRALRGEQLDPETEARRSE